MTIGNTPIKNGADVLGADGEKVGEVAAVEAGYIVVEKGFFFPTDYYIPLEMIQQVDEDHVYLTVTKDAALNQGWDRVPTDSTWGRTEDDLSARTTGTARTTEGVAAIPVHEEHLDASRRTVDAGEVDVTKRIVTEQETVEVPVTEERIRVDWRETPGSGTVDEGQAFQEGSFEIPITREEVDVRKRAVKTGEVEVTRERDQHTEQVTDTVRKEVVDVDEQGTEPKGKRRKRR
jgi:uncharacterized protein (TIGR02271 family)